MNCSEMMQISELKNVLCLKAGKGGLNSEVRWIYFADCLQCVQREYQMENYIHGGEFVILTNRKVTDNYENLMDLIEQMREHHITAIGINEGQISEQFMDYCEKNDLPLFELPEEYPLIDLSQNICKRLVLEENSRNSAEQLFSSILDAKHLNRESVLAQARYLDINLEGNFCVAEIAFDNKKKQGKKEHDPEDMFAQGQRIRKMIQSEFRVYSDEKLLILPQTGSILVLIPVQDGGINRIKETVLRIIERAEKECKSPLCAGIGNSKEYLTEIRESRSEAAAAARMASSYATGREMARKVLFFKEMGVYTLLSHIDSQKVMDDYVEIHIGKLIQADELHKGNLCETLEQYLNCSCNAKKTAEEMFVHRNTLNYRLKKISEILNCDFEELEDCLELKLAFKILRYRE